MASLSNFEYVKLSEHFEFIFQTALSSLQFMDQQISKIWMNFYIQLYTILLDN